MSKIMRVMSSIPQDVIDTEILFRLPIKSLLRFKLVSRHWNSLISSYEFAQNYLQYQRIYNIPKFVFQTKPKKGSDMPSKLYSLKVLKLDSHEDDHSTDQTKCFNLVSSRLEHGHCDIPMKEKLIGSSNGLICIRFTYKMYIDARHGNINNFLMWNPLTNQRRAIRAPSIPFQSYIFSFGFGFASSSDDYKIVLLTRVLNKNSTLVHLFSSKRDRWTKFSTKYFPFDDAREFPRKMRSVLAGETMYWLFLDKAKSPKVVSLELNTESFSMVDVAYSIPMVLADNDSIFICELRQCLCVCFINTGVNTVDLEGWMMQDSWTQVFQFKNLNKSLRNGHLRHIASRSLFELNDRVLCLGVGLNSLVSIHSSGSGSGGENGECRAKYTDIPVEDEESRMTVAFSYVESLVSPFCHLGRRPIARKAKLSNKIKQYKRKLFKF